MRVQSKVWLTSFGDLLTLLLCFFVVALSQGRDEALQKAQSKLIVSNDSRVQTKPPDTSGKQIASKQVTEFPHLAVSLDKGDFRPLFVGLNHSGSSKLKNFLKQNEGNLEVGLCNLSFDYPEAVFETLKNELATRDLRYSIGSAVCKSLVQADKQSLNDRILVSAYTKKNHGRREG